MGSRGANTLTNLYIPLLTVSRYPWQGTVLSRDGANDGKSSRVHLLCQLHPKTSFEIF